MKKMLPLLILLFAAHGSAAAEPSVAGLMGWYSGGDPVGRLNCRVFIEGFVAGVAVRAYNDRARYCLGRPVDDYIRAFLEVATTSESLRAGPRASVALFTAMTGHMGVRGNCPNP